MSEQTDKRAERLKAALRENLRRRKAQVRGRSGMAPEPAGRADGAGDPPQPGGRPSEDPPGEDPPGKETPHEEEDPA